MGSIKLKIVNSLLNLNIKAGKFLLFYKTKYEAEADIKDMDKSEKFDLRGMANRVKNVMLYDQDIIDKRWDECQKCEFLIKPTNNCKKCGCFMKIKTRIGASTCPEGKW